MFKFLFSRKSGAIEATPETQRQTVERALGEINEVLGNLDTLPRVIVDASAAAVQIDLPEQMPDEALALPAPSVEEETAPAKEPEVVETEETPADEAQEKEPA